MAAIDLAQRRLIDNYKPDPERSYNIPANYYTDPEIYEREKEAIFYRSWWYAGHVEEIPEPGCYKACPVVDQNTFIVRGKDRRLRAFYNVCAHRAHELVEGSGKEAMISCPYHGWTYRLDGGLFSARGSEKVKGFEPSEFCLKELRVEEFANFLFVNLDPEAIPLAKDAPELVEDFYRYCPDLDKLTKACSLRFEIKANWKIVVENFNECYHCPIAHPAFASIIDMKTYRIDTHKIHSSHHSRPKNTRNKAYNFDPDDPTQAGGFFVLWPNTLVWIMPGRANFGVLHCAPAGSELTVETFDLYLLDREPGEQEKAYLEYFRDVLNPEDISLCESVQRGLHSKGYLQSRYVVDPDRTDISEHAVHHFHGLVLDALAG
jgi:choline monooxygenase